MAYYRLYFLNSDKHIETYESFEADDDTAALAAAEARRTVLGKELWCEQRRLKQWMPPMNLSV